MTQPRDARGRFVSQDVREEFTEAEREFIRRCVRENPTIVRSAEERAAIAAQAAHPLQQGPRAPDHFEPYRVRPLTEADLRAFKAWAENQASREMPSAAALSGCDQSLGTSFAASPGQHPGPGTSPAYEEIFEAWSSAQKLRKPRRRWWWPFGRK
jgi:hypothetical protein